MHSDHPAKNPDQKYHQLSWRGRSFAPALWITTLIIAYSVSGCGQTGALYLPQATDVAISDGASQVATDPPATADTPTDEDAPPESGTPESDTPESGTPESGTPEPRD